MRLRETGTSQTSTIMFGEDGWEDLSPPHQCTITLTGRKGINQHRAVRFGRCRSCGKQYRQLIDWTNRRETKWREVA